MHVELAGVRRGERRGGRAHLVDEEISIPLQVHQPIRRQPRTPHDSFDSQRPKISFGRFPLYSLG